MENPFDLIKYHATLKPAENSIIEKYEGIFPEFVINEWKERGFSSYMKGLLIATNPEDFYDVLENWVEDAKNCHVIMRTAFGSMYYVKDGKYSDISVIHNLSSHSKNSFDIIIDISLTNKGVQKNILQKNIYDKAFKRLGAPDYDEVYAFTPAIALGGDYNPDTIQKVKLKEHLAFLQQLI